MVEFTIKSLGELKVTRSISNKIILIQRWRQIYHRSLLKGAILLEHRRAREAWGHLRQGSGRWWRPRRHRRRSLGITRRRTSLYEGRALSLDASIVLHYWKAENKRKKP
jgi:hypothetical protein